MTRENKIIPYNTPTLGGHWKRIYAVIDPKADHKIDYVRKEGQSHTKSLTEGSTWGVSAQVAIK